MAKIFELCPEIKTKEKLAEIFKRINFPSALEIVVQHLGKEPNYYLVFPEKYFKRARFLLNGGFPGIQAKEVDDYALFHHAGETAGAYGEALDNDKFFNLDFKRIDFSKVNEVAESALIQILFNPFKKERRFEIRFLSSAPSLYQAKEILGAIVSAFGEYKIREPQNKKLFINKVNFREP